MKLKGLKKLVTLGLILGITSAFTVGCASVNNASSDGSQTVPSKNEAIAETSDYKIVRIGTPGIDNNGNAILLDAAAIAQEKGFIEEELNKIGYTAEYYGFATQGVGVNEALAAEELDVAFYGDFPAVTYLSSGSEASIFAVDSSRVQLGIYATEAIQSVEDLKGKKIGSALGTNGYKFLVDLLNQNNIALDEVEIVNATSELSSLFVSGEIDAIAMTTQLFYTLQDKGGHILTVNGDEEALASYFIGVGRNEFLDANPEVAGALIRALKQAKEYAPEHADEVYEIFAGQSAYLTFENYKEIYSFNTTFDYWSPELTDEAIASLQKTADFMYENQYIKSEIQIIDYILEVEAE